MITPSPIYNTFNEVFVKDKRAAFNGVLDAALALAFHSAPFVEETNVTPIECTLEQGLDFALSKIKQGLSVRLAVLKEDLSENPKFLAEAQEQFCKTRQEAVARHKMRAFFEELSSTDDLTSAESFN